MGIGSFRERIRPTPPTSLDRRYTLPVERTLLSPTDLRQSKHGWMALRALVPPDRTFPDSPRYEKIKAGERFSEAGPVAKFKDSMGAILQHENFVRLLESEENNQLAVRIHQGAEGQWYIPLEMPQPIVDMIIAAIAYESSINPDIRNFSCELVIRLPKSGDEHWKKVDIKDPHFDFLAQKRSSYYLSSPPTTIEYSGECTQDSPPYSSRLTARPLKPWTLYHADQKWLHAQPDLSPAPQRGLGFRRLLSRGHTPDSRRLLFRIAFVEGKSYGSLDLADPEE